MKAGALFVPAGVTVSLPPVPPTSPFAASVPYGIFPERSVASVQPAAQAPDVIAIMVPLLTKTPDDHA